MKKSLIVLTLLISLVFSFSALLSGCGPKNDDVAYSTEDKPSSETAENNTDTGNKTSESEADSSTAIGNKRIVIVQESVDPTYDAVNKNALDTILKSGFEKGKNIEITELKMTGDTKKTPEEVINIIKDSKPDLALFVVGPTCIDTVIKPLEDSGIPIVVNGNAEVFVDENGKPRQNITGVYNFPKDLQYNAFSLLQKISPLNGKKAVFITVGGFFKQPEIEKALKDQKIELKEYLEVPYVEDYKEAVLKYNKDPEVGWILPGICPGNTKDGKAGLQMETIRWDVENRKKPTVTFWDTGVKMGILCGLCVNLEYTGNQIGDIAVRLLKGEKVENIPAEEPSKINIDLNQKRAKDFGIEFPSDILGSAHRVYTDFEGNYIPSN